MGKAFSNDGRWAIGLMTGTVLDGNIDTALIKTDGRQVQEFGAFELYPYSNGTVSLLREAVEAAVAWNFDGDEPEVFAEAEHQLTIEQSNAVKQLLKRSGLSAADIAVVGFHGQTVLHRPPTSKVLGKTRQLGDGALMAENLGISVVNDFRSADMQAGGQGAPLCAIYHQAMLQALENPADAAVLNLGGIGNVSWWDGGDTLIAFDTGPANAPINDFVRQCGLGDMDVNGVLAEKGRVNETKLLALLEHDYFAAPYPKSLDRFDFSWQMAAGEKPEDGVALLTALCGASVGRALDLLPKKPHKLLVSGGGRHNPSILNAIAKYAGVDVDVVESVGAKGDATEAECFAFLAMRKLKGLPISFPGTTGASTPVSGGVLHSL